MSEDGNIIKRGPGAVAEARGVLKRPVVEALAEARRIRAEAEAEARALRESAERAARELREAAYEEGREAALSEFAQLLLDARERRDAAVSSAERDVLTLAVKLAEKIIGREIERDPAALADIVAAALRHARQSEALTVRVNPADLPAVEAHRARLDPAGRARFLDLVADPRVGPGGCVIESESGTVDARLETQLRVLERALLARAAGDGG
jgi:type III secretion protein L